MNEIINSSVSMVNDIGGSFFGFAAAMFIQVSLMIFVLWVIDKLLRKRVRATFRYCIWMLVLIKLILPPSLSSPTGIGNWIGDYFSVNSIVSLQQDEVADTTQQFKPIEQQELEETAAATQTRPSRRNAYSKPEVSVLPEIRQTEEIPGATEVSELPQSPELTQAPQVSAVVTINTLTWQGGIFLVWLLGVSILFALLIQRVLFVRGLIAQSEPAKNRLLDILYECKSLVGLQQGVQLKLSQNATSPAVCGVFRSVILIPTELLGKVSREKLRAVLIHELSHIKRGDLWVNCAQTILQILYFYNPFVWLANTVIRRNREQAVDEMVLVALGAEAKSYSDTLIDIAEMAFSRLALSLRLVGVVESKKALSGRIKHIVNRPFPKTAKLGLLGLLVVIIIAAILLPMEKSSKSDFFIDATKGYIRCNLDIEELGRIKINMARTYEFKQEFASSTGFGDSESPVKYSTTNYIIPNNKNLRIDAIAEKGRQLIINIDVESGALYTTEEMTIELARQLGLFKTAKPMINKSTTIVSGNFTAILPSGLTVELLGVCEYPSEDKQWWRPDGALLNQPYEKLKTTYIEPNYKLYELVYRISGVDVISLENSRDDDVKGHFGIFPLAQKAVGIKLPNADDCYSVVISCEQEIKEADVKMLIGSDSQSEWVTFKNVSLDPDFIIEQSKDDEGEVTNWIIEEIPEIEMLKDGDVFKNDNWVSIIASVVKNSGRYIIPESGLVLSDLIRVAGYNKDNLEDSYIEVIRRKTDGTLSVQSIFSRNIKTLFNGKESDILLQPGDSVVGGYIGQILNFAEFWRPYHFTDAVELTINDDGEQSNMFADLDTGILITPPDSLDNNDETAVLDWIESNGIELMGETAESGLIGFNIYAAQVDDYFWDADKSTIVNRLMSRVGNPILLKANERLPATYLIKTSEYNLGILQILGFDQNPRSIRIRYKLLKKEESANIQQSQNDFKATLPSGVTVELLGVCDIPAEGKQWWSADGSIIDNVFWDGTTIRNNYNRTRQVVFRILSDTNDPDIEPAVSFDPKRQNLPEGPSFVGGFIVSERGSSRTIEDLRGLSFSLNDEQDIIDIVATVGYGQWKTQGTKKFDSFRNLVSGLTNVGTLIINEPTETEGKTTITATLLNQTEAWRIIAIDKQGAIHVAGTSVASGNKVENEDEYQLFRAEFNVPLSKIAEFQFQTRNVEKFTFKNVSLEPGLKTDVQIEVETPIGQEADETVQIILSDADSRNNPNVLDLASGQTFTIPDDLRTDENAISEYFMERSVGDLWFTDGDIIGILRGGTIQLWDGVTVEPLSIKQSRGLIKSYSLRDNLLLIPCRLLVTDREGLEYGVEILKLTEDGGIELKYELLNDYYATKQSDFEATLFSGVTVELLGICEHPSEGKQWWKPDGSFLEESPYDDIWGRAFPQEGEKGYKFAVKFSSLAGKDIDCRIIPTNSKTTNGGALFSTSKKNDIENVKYVDGSLDEKIVWLGAAFDKELDYCNIMVGVSFGDWKAEYKYETDQQNDAVEWVVFPNITLRPDVKTEVQNEDENPVGQEGIENQEISGLVKDPNGNPAVNAQVALSTDTVGVLIKDGRLEENFGSESRIVHADSQGRFDLGQKPDGNFILFAAHDSGFAQIEYDSPQSSYDMQLQPWGRIEGQLAQGRGANGNQIWMTALPYSSIREYRYETRCGVNRRFIFEKVPAGWFDVGYLISMSGMGSASVTSRRRLEVKAGQTSTVILGGEGRPVTGKFVFPEGYEKPFTFDGYWGLVTAWPPEPRPEDYDQMTTEQQQQWRNQWRHTEDYKKYREDYFHDENWRQYTFYLNEDGTFIIEDVIPGKYNLNVTMFQENKDTQLKEVALESSFDIEVPQMEKEYSNEALDIGELDLEIYVSPEAETPIEQGAENNINASDVNMEMPQLFTLSDAALMSLDVYSGGTARIIEKRDIPGQGVEFDLYFPPGETSLYYHSSRTTGNSSLIHIDINQYIGYCLKFTLINFEGRNTNLDDVRLGVGANIGRPGRYTPAFFYLSEKNKTVISSTSLGPDDIEELDFIGFNVYLLGQENINSEGLTITLKIEAVPDVSAKEPRQRDRTEPDEVEIPTGRGQENMSEQNEPQIIIQADVITIARSRAFINGFLSNELGLDNPILAELTDSQVEKFREWASSVPETNIVSSPNTLAMDGQPSEMNFNTINEFITGYQQDANSPSGYKALSKVIETGIEIVFTPELRPDNQRIVLDMNFEKEDIINVIEKTHESGHQIRIPVVERQKISSKVALQIGKYSLLPVAGLESPHASHTFLIIKAELQKEIETE